MWDHCCLSVYNQHLVTMLQIVYCGSFALSCRLHEPQLVKFVQRELKMSPHTGESLCTLGIVASVSNTVQGGVLLVCFCQAFELEDLLPRVDMC